MSKISIQCFSASACVHLGILRKNNEIIYFLKLIFFKFWDFTFSSTHTLQSKLKNSWLMKFTCCLVLNVCFLFGSFRVLLSVLRSAFVAEIVVLIFKKYRQIGENYVIVDSYRFLPHLLQFIFLNFGAVKSGLQILSLKETLNTKCYCL